MNSLNKYQGLLCENFYQILSKQVIHQVNPEECLTVSVLCHDISSYDSTAQFLYSKVIILIITSILKYNYIII